MNWSYWEKKQWLTNVDFTIIGSGIVGLNCALQLKKDYPKAKILILEQGILPQGASTKNAGFACFGSLSECLDDLKTHSETEVFNLVNKRQQGLLLLRKQLGDKAIAYKSFGGYELFSLKANALLESCYENINAINTLLNPIFKADTFKFQSLPFHFNQVQKKVIFNPFEGQIDTGKMMSALLKKVHKKGIFILNTTKVTSYQQQTHYVTVNTPAFSFKTRQLFMATNGFASQLLNLTVKPARAQVLITKPIKDLKIKGTFHLEKGYYYFRNIDNRILFGGGRHLDFKAEETSTFAQTAIIQNQLNTMLKEVILPTTTVEVDYAWSGIMGVGAKKEAIVKSISNNVHCGVRLGGMGIAIGSAIGVDLASLIK